MSKHVVVVGAGIVGVSAGIWLTRMGQRVTLVDRSAPGQGTSFGNAGLLASCAMVPVTTPGLVSKAPKMVLDPDAPLFLRWSYLPRLAPWLVRYLRHANDSDTRRIAAALTPITGDSVDQHLALTDGLDARKFVSPSEYVFAYPSREDFDNDKYVWELRREHGFVPRVVEGSAVHEYDANYGPDVGCLAVLKDHGYVLDPGAYVAALARELEAMGGTYRQGSVVDIDGTDTPVKTVRTDQGDITCDAVVLASGAWSKPLMKKLNLNVPLETERGYHIVFRNARGIPRSPTMIAAGKFVATPMSAGLRCAGIVEFGGLEAGPSEAPFELLRRKAKAAFPHLEYDGEETWMGHRPATTDSLPLIGEVGKSGVYAAFGHQHVGLTCGPKTGRLVAGLIADQPTNMDLTPYAPQRFA